MKQIGLVIFLGVALPLLALAITILVLKLRQRRIRAALAALTKRGLDEIYSQIESLSSFPPTGAILAYTGQPAPSADAIIVLPTGLLDFPWGGQAFRLQASGEQELTFQNLSTPPAVSQLAGKQLRSLKVPRQALKSGQGQDILEPARYLALSAGLRSRVDALFPSKPEALLSWLLCGLRMDFDAIDQIRIGTAPVWARAPQLPHCPVCNNRMRLVIQLPGNALQQKAYRDGMYYLFGCPDHPQPLVPVTQFS